MRPLVADLAAERPLDNAVDALDAVARAPATVPRSSLPADVIFGQFRSTVVDLFQVAGLDLDSRWPRCRPREGSTRSETHHRLISPTGQTAEVPVGSGEIGRMGDNVFPNSSGRVTGLRRRSVHFRSQRPWPRAAVGG